MATKDYGGKYRRYTEQSAADTALSLSTLAGVAHRLLFVAVRYSASPTQAGVGIDLDSGAGTAWDTRLSTGSANAQNTVFLPENAIRITDDDVIKVTAPSAGGVITSQISIYVELL